jgi:hypothetical protein
MQPYCAHVRGGIYVAQQLAFAKACRSSYNNRHILRQSGQHQPTIPIQMIAILTPTVGAGISPFAI